MSAKRVEMKCSPVAVIFVAEANTNRTLAAVAERLVALDLTFVLEPKTSAVLVSASLARLEREAEDLSVYKPLADKNTYSGRRTIERVLEVTREHVFGAWKAKFLLASRAGELSPSFFKQNQMLENVLI